VSTNQAGVLADLDAQMTALIGAPYTHLRADIKDKLLTAIAYAIAQWSPSSSGATAEALGTTGADVNVGAAAPPSTGQVLTATDATHATWQTPTAGSSDHAALTHLDYASAGHTGFVPATRTVAGHALSADVTITAADVGALGATAAAGGDLSGAYPSPTVATAAITLAKMADLATDRLIGRDTAGTGVPEALTVGGGLEFTGSGGIQRSALSGDATAAAGSGTVAIADFTGDSGAGGVHGFVPAPAAGDALAGKVLAADGSWAMPITAGRTYYLDPLDSSDIAGYYTALVAPSANAETTLGVTATGTGNNLLAAFATEPGVPGALLIPHGSAGRHFHVSTGATNQIARLLVEVYTCLADGTSETLIRSGYSPEFFGATPQELTFSFDDPAGYTITATQRIVYKVYAARVSGPASCVITVYFDGTDRAAYVTSTILTPAVLVTTLTGDVTGTGSGSIATTLANSGVTAGSKGSASMSPTITVDAKGRVTALSESAITVSGSGFGSILTTEEDMMVRRGGSATRLPKGSEETVLKMVGGLVTWAPAAAMVLACNEVGIVNDWMQSALRAT